MNENFYEMMNKTFKDADLTQKDGIIFLDFHEGGKIEMHSIFPGIILAFIDIRLNKSSDLFIEDAPIKSRLLEINHCIDGRYAYQVKDDKLIYFGRGDLCISIYDLTKSVSDFPAGYYRGLEFFIDVDVSNDYITEFLPDFNLADYYEDLENNAGYLLVRANEKIDHVIGELYGVDERIQESYFKIKTLELLLFFSITHFSESSHKSLSINQAKIVENVYNDLTRDLEKAITIDELADKYGISKTALKNCFKEVYGKPIFKWRKEYKLEYACRLINDDEYSISEISRMVGYSSPSNFAQAFKEYVGCTPSEYRK